jgi:hypothetical protein
MKKIIVSFIMSVAILFLAACNSSKNSKPAAVKNETPPPTAEESFEADVRQLAGYQCKFMKLAEKIKAGDTLAKKDEEALEKELIAFTSKMEEKYKDKKDDKTLDEKANKILTEVMANCK